MIEKETLLEIVDALESGQSISKVSEQDLSLAWRMLPSYQASSVRKNPVMVLGDLFPSGTDIKALFIRTMLLAEVANLGLSVDDRTIKKAANVELNKETVPAVMRSFVTDV